MNLDDLLTSEGAEAVHRHMIVRGAEGKLITAPAEVTRRMLALLANREGNGDRSEDGLHFGRATVLPLIIDALIGPDPDGEAWLAAIAEGSFDLSISKRYGKVTEVGPPGTYLPRLVQRWDTERTKHNPSPNQLRRYRTALGILIASVLLRELKNATNARAAIGAAWPVMRAISHRQYAELRRDLAQFGADEPFLVHLAKAVASAVQDWKHNHMPQVILTNRAVDSSVPPGVNVAEHFARQALAELRREDAFVAFGPALFGTEPAADDAAKRAIERLHQILPLADVRRLTQQDVSAATAYLDKRASVDVDLDMSVHHERLRFLMPICAGPATSEQVIGRALGAIRFTNFDFEPDAIMMTGTAIADTLVARTAASILIYAREVGPPPPGVPIDHLHWFEVSACYLAFKTDWLARDRWQAAGLMPPSMNSASIARFHALLFEWSAHSTIGEKK